MITEQDAIEAARLFVARTEHAPLDDRSITVAFHDDGKRPAFAVSARDTGLPGEAHEPEWMRTPLAPVTYLVDARSGTVFGIVTERGRTLFG